MLDQTNPLAILKKGGELSTETMHTWSDDRRKEFTKTFTDRTTAARFILAQTAWNILHTARRRKFISEKHLRKIGKFERCYGDPLEQYNPRGQTDWYDDGYQNRASGQIGGRAVQELLDIAEERSKLILAELPPLKKAVQVIDKVTAERIDQRDRLLKRGEALREQLEDLSHPIELKDVDPTMTVGDFRKMVLDQAKRRKQLVEKMNDIGKEGCELEDQINKALFAGLPGLSDAVVKVATDYEERAKAMDQLCRRVNEQVMFGDSKAATNLLERFERDEVQLEGEIKAEFSTAMQKLKEAAKGLTSKTAKAKKLGTAKKAKKAKKARAKK